MPSYYRIDRESGTVLYRTEGDVAEEDMIKTSNAVARDPEYRVGMNGIADVRAVDSNVSVSADALRELSDFNRMLPEELIHPRMAIVADTDLLYGLSRMWQMYSEDLPNDYAVFRDITEACDWLGISTAVWDTNDDWTRVD